MHHWLAPLLMLGVSNAAGTQAPPAATETPAALEHVHRAEQIAGKDVTYPLFLCRPDGAKTAEKALNEGKVRFPPSRAFDNLYYLGSTFVGVWVVKTSEGLIMFDSGQSTEEARDHIVPELRSLGLDPAQLKYVLVTHGHWDHFGGAKYLQDTFHARIGMGAPDWYMLAREEKDSAERYGRDRPHEDLAITDGQKLTLGDTTISLYITPGHTPGTISAIVPVHEDGKVYKLSLLGGTVFPPTIEPADRHGGLLGFSRAIERLATISRDAGAVGLINTHSFVDGSADHVLAAANARAKGLSNPMIVGTDAVVRHYGVVDECLKAAMARPPMHTHWSDPLPKEPTPD